MEPDCGYIEIEPGSAGWLCIFGYFQAGKCFPVQSLIDNSDCDGLDSGFEVETSLYTFDAQKRLFFWASKLTQQRRSEGWSLNCVALLLWTALSSDTQGMIPYNILLMILITMMMIVVIFQRFFAVLCRGVYRQV